MKEMFRMVDKSKVDEVKQMLEYTQKGTAKATVGNYMVVLRNDPLVRESMKYNKLTGRIDIVKKLWWNEEVCKLDDDGRTYFYYFFERYYKLTSEKCMDKALRIEANSRAYHPICEYLEQLEWDGQERIRYVLQRYTENTIENGMKRLSVIKTPFNKTNIDRINRQMLKMSGQRDTLKERWNSALAVYDKMDIVDETEVKDKFVTSVVFWDAILTMILSGILCLIGAIGAGIVAAASQNGILAGTCYFFIAAGLAGIMIRFPKIFMLGSPLKRLKAFGNGIRKALEEQQLLEETHCKVETESNGPDNHIIYLSGGSGRDKALFAQCVNEFFDVIDNQRYILVKKKGHKGLNGFYAIPNCFSKKKEDAERFAKCMHPYIGNYDCVYTRNEKGRELLLEGRVKALANREERCISHKKVKGALE